MPFLLINQLIYFVGNPVGDFHLPKIPLL